MSLVLHSYFKNFRNHFILKFWWNSELSARKSCAWPSKQKTEPFCFHVFSGLSSTELLFFIIAKQFRFGFCFARKLKFYASQNCSKVVQIWGLDAKMNTFLNIWTCDARPHFQEFEASWQRYELRTKTVILTFFDRRLWVEVSKHIISDNFQFYQRGRIFHACSRRAILTVCGPA